ncbi:ABC transporter ATP-binding protein [Nakamurella endophytica]|uniref:ABC-type quaternary amine transporter n=1 Tax=Nakamurella endophytica TaxID=1748367 RepID=A0A917STZ8_9ACTN|nr:ABC transporter ATP-binding protein [Nakamurella endophytica]GGL94837.1 polyamine-transporting ATPase [Nakamurella endophytica]
MSDAGTSIGGARNPVAAGGSRLVIDGVVKQFGGHTALADVSLDVQPGEFMTLLGPSGSGKSTTLNLVSGFAQPDEGTVRIDGVDMASVPPRRRNVGMVFQNYALFPHLTIEANIAFPLRQRRVPRPEQARRVAEALGTVRLEGYGQRYPAQLSGGQQQRVALARAIVFRPGLLLMDEPLGALDRGLRESMQSEIRRIHREAGSTVLFVTHDQEEALALSDRIAVFHEGRIEQVGTGHELYLHPASTFVAGFLGESTMLPAERSAGGAWSVLGVRVPAPSAVPDAARSATVVVRPERARLRAVDDARQDELGLSVQVLEDVYLGADRKLRVRFADGTAGVVREVAGSMSPWRAGDRVEFAWRPADSAVLPGSAAPAVL